MGLDVRKGSSRLGRALIVSISLLLVGPGLVWAEDDESEESASEEPNYLELASMLLRDGHVGRAERALERVEPDEDDPEFDRVTYDTLGGLIALENGDHEAAVEDLEAAIEGDEEPESTLYVYLAQAHYGLEDWEATTEAVQSALDAGQERAELHLMSAHAHRELGEREEAWVALERGESRHEDNPEFLRQKIYLLIDLGLYRRAAELGEAYLADGERDVDDYLALGQAFRRAGAHRRATEVLESAQLRFPQDTDVTVHLAHAHIDRGHLRSAAELLQRAAVSDPSYREESAELFRRAGAYERALYMNAQIHDQSDKFRQRVAILLDQKKFEEIAALETRLSRLGLLDDDQMVYTVAYARFQTRDFAGAERLLEQISDADVYESAVELRRTVQLCREEPLGC
ncbi:MAG: tetratricopeptide repeat protein [Persicimonas sp.]